MLEVKLGNGSIIESVVTVRELVQIETGQQELNIITNQDSDLAAIYAAMTGAGALDTIIIVDRDNEAEQLVLSGYTHIATLERIFNSVGAISENFRVNIRLTRD